MHLYRHYLPFALAALLLCAIQTSAQETLIPAGNVSGVWTASESPYLIQGNIRLPEGETLTIEPGTEVLFTGPYFLRILGDFNASGSDADSVRFSWSSGQINLSGINLDSLSTQSDTARFNRCVFTDMQAGRIRIWNVDKVVIENSHFHSNSGHASGLVFIANSTNIRVVGNRFENNAASASSTYGGAIYIADSSPDIIGNTFKNNSATFAGGALSIWRQNTAVTPLIKNNLFEGNSAPSAGAIDIKSNVVPHIEANQFINNTASVSGGAIWQSSIAAGTVTYKNNVFSGNTTNQRGGAIRSISAMSSFDGDVFENNSTSSFNGGAIHFNNENTATLTNCRFSGNSANNGGAISIQDGGTVVFDRCTINNNTANASGGALLLDAYVNATFTNCLIAQNTASNLGGVVRMSLFCDPLFVNCTFAGNHANTNGAVASLYWASNPTFANCLWWGNTAVGGNQLLVQDYIQNFCVPNFDHCLIDGGQSSFSMGTSSVGDWVNVINEDPLFVLEPQGSGANFDALSADFRLSAEDSPAVAAGTETGYNLGDFDLAGHPRVSAQGVDLGCYAFVEPEAPLPLDFNGDGVVDTNDFLLFLANYGCVGEDCIGDLTGDGIVGVEDLLLLLTMW